MPYWFGFRQVIPKPPGSWIGTGSYRSYDEAMTAYESEKMKSDAEVFPPFEAENQADADRIAQERG